MDYKKKYNEALERANKYNFDGAKQVVKDLVFYIFPELKESEDEDERMKKSIIQTLKKYSKCVEDGNDSPSAKDFLVKDIENQIAWLEKQNEQKDVLPIPTRETVLAIWELGNKWRGLTEGSIFEIGNQLEYIQKHWQESTYYLTVKQSEQKPSVVDFKAEDWYVSKVDGKIYNAKFMESSEKQGEQVEINPSEFDLRLNRLLKQFESLPKEELANSLSFYLNVVQNDGTYVEEKQGEQKPTDKVEPKFKVGDWVVTSYGKVNQVITVDENGDGFTLDDDTYFSGSWIDGYHLWSIADAKDGDVLQLGNVTAIFQEYIGSGNCKCYCSVYNGEFEIPSQDNSYGCHNAIPATKEQRDILFAKMKEIGYEWDADKKELKKIKQKSTNKNITNVDHEYYSDLLSNDDSDTIDEYAYQCAYCMSHDWMKETATWEDVQKAVKLGAEWQKQKPAEWSEDDETKMRAALAFIKSEFPKNGDEEIMEGTIEWLKSLKQRIGG